MIDRQKMSRLHEIFLAKVLGGRKSRGSGNQWHDAADGRNNHLIEEFAFAWDGKATLGKSISITREMWEKIKEQAGGERPMLALRFYGNERCDEIDADLAVVSMDDFTEILSRAREERPETERGHFTASMVRVYMPSLDGSTKGHATVDGIPFPLESCVFHRELGNFWMKVNGWLVEQGEVWQDDILIMSMPQIMNRLVYVPGRVS